MKAHEESVIKEFRANLNNSVTTSAKWNANECLVEDESDGNAFGEIKFPGASDIISKVWWKKNIRWFFERNF